MTGLEFIKNIKGMSYAEIGRKIGVARQQVYVWVKGGRPIPEHRLDQLSWLFNIPKGYIAEKELTDEDKKFILESQINRIDSESKFNMKNKDKRSEQNVS